MGIFSGISSSIGKTADKGMAATEHQRKINEEQAKKPNVFSASFGGATTVQQNTNVQTPLPSMKGMLGSGVQATAQQ